MQWRGVRLEERKQLVRNWIRVIESDSWKEKCAKDLALCVGKPISQGLGEVKTTVNRAKVLLDIVDQAIAEQKFADLDEGNTVLQRKIVREAIGPVLVLAPWNYPYLCAINVVIPAILAGNSVVLKHADRTANVAEFIEEMFDIAGAPKGLVQAVHAPHQLVADMIQNPDLAYVAFTGSVKGGRVVYESVAKAPRFIDVGLELGGKDAAYVSKYADVKNAIENVVDGAMYNSGQSCCAVERVYVHKDVYDEFLQGAIEAVQKNYKLGDPLDPKTNLGPIAQPTHVGFLQKQISQALVVEEGAQLHVGGKAQTDENGKGRFFSPTVISGCTHRMSLMVEESFGPILAIAKPVESDEEAVNLINDSSFGLTASVWTEDNEQFEKIAPQLDVGTVFQNRCDFVDPLLPWSGRYDSGKGGPSCSTLGYIPLTKTKAYNVRRKKN
jgi:acyl-CoA reductase-like NAD-dependent aldehyde dehydrogenase